MKTYSKQSLSLEAAQQMVKAATQKARQLEMAVSIAIVDESGHLIAFAKMNGAPLISYDAAMKKAKTAVGFGMPSGESWYNFIKDDPILSAGVQSLADFTLLGGGSPIFIDNSLVGAIGVSGGHYSQDEQCVQAGLKSLNIE